MHEDRARLTFAELAVVDALISVAQERGIGMDDDDDPPSGAAEAFDGRHDGIFRHLEAEVLPKIREMTQELGTAPTLRKLIELRGRAVRGG